VITIKNGVFLARRYLKIYSCLPAGVRKINPAFCCFPCFGLALSAVIFIYVDDDLRKTVVSGEPHHNPAALAQFNQSVFYLLVILTLPLNRLLPCSFGTSVRVQVQCATNDLPCQ
jgi:hypothetical protein